MTVQGLVVHQINSVLRINIAKMEVLEKKVT